MSWTQSYLLFGPLKIYFYSIFIFIGVFVGYWWTLKRAHSYGFTAKQIEEIFITLTPFSIIGARIYHVSSSLTYYLRFKKEILDFRQGGLGIYGAVIAGAFSLLFFCRWKKINLWRMLDLLSPAVLLSQAIGRFGNYFNQEVFGPPTFLPWGIYISPEIRPMQYLQSSYFHPVYLYESILLIASFILITKYEKYLAKKNGRLFGTYLISYGFSRFLTEILRFDTWQIDHIKVAQIISVSFIALGAILILNGKIFRKLIK